MSFNIRISSFYVTIPLNFIKRSMIKGIWSSTLYEKEFFFNYFSVQCIFLRNVFYVQFPVWCILQKIRLQYQLRIQTRQVFIVYSTMEYWKVLSVMTLKTCHRKLEAHDIRYVWKHNSILNCCCYLRIAKLLNVFLV